MLYLKRALTAIGCFIPLTIILFIIMGVILGGIAGGMASANANATNYEEGYEAGRKAGEEIGEKYGALMFFGSVFISGIIAAVVGFSGILPWCKRKPELPRPSQPGSPPPLENDR